MPDADHAPHRAMQPACLPWHSRVDALSPHACRVPPAWPNDPHAAFQPARLQLTDRVSAWHRRSSIPLAVGSSAPVQAARPPPITPLARPTSRALYRVACRASFLVRRLRPVPAVTQSAVLQSTTEPRRRV